MARRRAMSSESFLLQLRVSSPTPTTPSREAQVPVTPRTVVGTPVARAKAPCLLEVKQSSLNSFAGRVSIPTTRGLGSSTTYSIAEHVASTSRPVRQQVLRKHSFRDDHAKRILRKASGLQEHASIHSSQIRERRKVHHNHTASGGITPPSVRRSVRKATPRKNWDELSPNAGMKHKIVCLRCRRKFEKGKISKQEFARCVVDSATALGLPEPFAAEFFVDVCHVGRSSPVVAGRGQLRRVRKHNDLLAAAALQQEYEDAQIEVGCTSSDEDLSVGSDWDTDSSYDSSDDSSDETWTT